MYFLVTIRAYLYHLFREQFKFDTASNVAECSRADSLDAKRLRGLEVFAQRIVEALTVACDLNRPELQPNHQNRVLRIELLGGVGANDGAETEVLQLVELFDKRAPAVLGVRRLQFILDEAVHVQRGKLGAEGGVNFIVIRCQPQAAWIDAAKELLRNSAE